MNLMMFALLLVLQPPALVGDGVTDDGPALRAALATVNATGGVLNIPPGRFKIIATADNLCIGLQDRVTLRGQCGLTTLVVESDAPAAYRELLRLAGDRITIENIELTRAGPFTGILLKLYPVSRLRLSGVTIDGQTDAFGPGVHAIEVAAQPGGVSDGVLMERCEIVGTQSAMFMTNESTASLKNFTATDCFIHDCGRGFDFNGPNGTMEGIRLARCRFERIGLDAKDDGGFGVGLARVRGASITDCSFDRVTGAGVHIENGTREVTITGSRFTDCGSKAVAAVNCINASRRISIIGNSFTSPDVSIATVLVGTGGDFPVAGDVIVSGNSFDLGASACGVQAFGTFGVMIVNNSFTGSGPGATNWGVSVQHATDPRVTGNTFCGLGRSIFADLAQPPVNATIESNTASGCGQPAPMPTVVVPVPPTLNSQGVPDQARALLPLHNAARAAAGLPPLAWSDRLAVAAQGHATVMAAKGLMSHDAAGDGNEVTRAAAVGYVGWTRLAENIGADYPTPAAMMAAWLASPEHRANVLRADVADFGAGYAVDSLGTPFWCGAFGARP